MIELFNADCLTLFQSIKDQSVDLVLCDPPYGITSNEWDTVIDIQKMWTGLKRIAKETATFLLFTDGGRFHSDLIQYNEKQFSHCLYWRKTNKVGFQLSGSQPLKEIETIAVFRGVAEWATTSQSNLAFKHYLKARFNESNITLKQLNTLCGFEASGYLRCGSSWANVLPSQEKLKIIANALDFNINEASSLLNSSESNKRFTYNPQNLKIYNKKNKRSKSGSNYTELAQNDYIQQYTNYPTNLLEFPSKTTKSHPTEKPIELLRYLIKTYSNEGDIVLDFACGSGSTLVACKETKRNAVGIEKEFEFYEKARTRLMQS